MDLEILPVHLEFCKFCFFHQISTFHAMIQIRGYYEFKEVIRFLGEFHNYVVTCLMQAQG